MNDGTWRLLAEKMQQEFENRNSLLGDLLRMGSLRTEGGVYIPTNFSDEPPATWSDAEPDPFSLDDLNELIDMLGPRQDRPYYHMVVSRREMRHLDEAIASIQQHDVPVSGKLFGMPVVVSDAVPEGKALMVSRPLFGFSTWSAMRMEFGDWAEDAEAFTDDSDLFNLQPWQLYIILLVVMAVIVLLLGG